MKAILDTGPWVALIDRSEAMHDRCVKWFKQYTGKMYSTEAVLTEVLYLLNFAVDAQAATMEFVLESVVELVPVGIDSLNRIKTLMIKYADLPMDYADATIVCLAMETGIRNIITLDKKDFSIHKIKKQPFVIMP